LRVFRFFCVRFGRECTGREEGKKNAAATTTREKEYDGDDHGIWLHKVIIKIVNKKRMVKKEENMLIRG